MEKEDVLKAGHCVEPFKGMQLCAAATLIRNARAVRRAVEAGDAISFALAVPPRELKIKEGFQNAQCLLQVGAEGSFEPPTKTLLAGENGRLIRETNLRAARSRKLIPHNHLIPPNPCLTFLIDFLTHCRKGHLVHW